ncbi:hypothetical protein [Blastopirellula marina]|nr:hypothetical protein [Blastopirellula marina]
MVDDLGSTSQVYPPANAQQIHTLETLAGNDISLALALGRIAYPASTLTNTESYVFENTDPWSAVTIAIKPLSVLALLPQAANVACGSTAPTIVLGSVSHARPAASVVTSAMEPDVIFEAIIVGLEANRRTGGALTVLS